MRLTMRACAAALICAMFAGMAISTAPPAQAQSRSQAHPQTDSNKKGRRSFLHRLFNVEPRREKRSRLNAADKRRKLQAIGSVRVSSPKIFTYQPDVLKTVSLAGLAEKQTAVSGPEKIELAQAEPQVDADLVTGTVTTASDASPADATGLGRDPANGAESAFERNRGYLSGVALRTFSQVGDALLAHYTAYPRLIWITDGRINAEARAVLAVLERADEFGLSAEDYRVSLPGDPSAQSAAPQTLAAAIDATEAKPVDETESEAAQSGGIAVLQEDAAGTGDAAQPGLSDNPVGIDDPAAREKALMRFEMMLSAKALTYVLDANRGRVDPNRLSGYHDLPRHEVDLAAALAAIATSGNAAATLESSHPDNAVFASLKAELAAIRGQDQDQGERIEIADGTLIKPGGSSAELANVVAAVTMRGSDTLKSEHAQTLEAYQGGDAYSPELVELVRAFQRENKLTADGVIGRNTIRAMAGVTNADKIQKIVLAMERLRWLPRQFGARHVFINQAAFTATYRDTDQEPLSMRVVVGKKSNQTNFFYDEIETVEYNPYWGVPLSIIVNEMLPKLTRDPAYLDKIGYEVTTIDGQRISSTAVDWYGVATQAVPINVRQLPGSQNALGELKILFPNKHAIYMHDTPARNLFERDSRAFSHGCIRLQYPHKMAAAVLGKSTDYIASRIANGENESEPVAGKIPVYSTYFTAWPEDGAGIAYYDDVYDRDKNLIKALDRTKEARQAAS